MARFVRPAVALIVMLAAGTLPAPAPAVEPPVAADDVEEVEAVEAVEAEPASAGASRGPSGGVRDLVGRFHNSLVHFPIGWLLMVLLLDAATFLLRRRELEAAGLWALGATVLAFGPAIATGLLREEFVSQAPAVHALVETHETLVFVTAGVVAAAFLLRLWARKDLVGAKKGAYLALIVTAGVLVSFAGHWGGKVAWGPNYLPF